MEAGGGERGAGPAAAPGDAAREAPLALRPWRPEDRDALVALWQACDLLRPWNDPDADLALMAASEDAEVMVGEIEGRIVASAFVGHDGHRGWLYYLATDPALRGRGLGGRMVRHCEDWLRERDVPKCQVMIRQSNLGARRFYQRIGYEPNNCALMQRWLKDTGAPRTVEGARADGRLETTVTYLEMLERPGLPPVSPPRGRKVALLRAEKPSLAFYRFLYDQVGAPWLWWERRVLPDDELRGIVQDPMVEIYVLYVAGQPAGFAELDLRDMPSIDLSYFGLMPDFIGMGLGPYLLSAAIESAWSREPERLTVNTNTLDHPRALPLYQRFGFRPYSRVSGLIDDPRLSGIIPV